MLEVIIPVTCEEYYFLGWNAMQFGWSFGGFKRYDPPETSVDYYGTARLFKPEDLIFRLKRKFVSEFSSCPSPPLARDSGGAHDYAPAVLPPGMYCVWIGPRACLEMMIEILPHPRIDPL
jgi:hypothetical protein